MTTSEHLVVNRWAADTDCELLSSESRMFSTGPFSGEVYYVKVRDRAGHAHSGWLHFGRRFWGLLSDKAEVRWEN
jgi:hypothetical protein